MKIAPPPDAQEGPVQIRLEDLRADYERAIDYDDQWLPRAEEDAEFLANIQWTKKQKDRMQKRGQAPLTMNQIHRDYYTQLGRQIRNRLDPGVKARGNSDAQLAMGLTDVITFLLQVNNWDYEQTWAVMDQLAVGRGFVFCGYQNDDLTQHHIRIRQEDWRNIRRDPASRRRDMSDARFMTVERWVPCRDVHVRYPAAANQIDQMVKGDPNEPRGFHQMNPKHEARGGDPYKAAYARGDSSKYVSKEQDHVRIVEMWFRVPTLAWQIKYADGRVVLFDANNPQHLMDSRTSGNLLVHGPYQQMMFVIFSGDVILAQGPSPYSHGMFPYFPFWGYTANVGRATEDVVPGETYGMVRIAKDPQRLQNSTYSKIRHILNTRQVVMGKGVADRRHVEENAANPGGIIELDNPDGMFKFSDQLAHAGHLGNLLLRADKAMESSTGINEASRGVGPEQSGTALFARQNQSETTNTLFQENQRFAVMMLARALVSMIQESMTQEEVVRITEDLGDKVIAINVSDPYRAQQLMAEGVHAVYGSVTQGQYDVIVTDIDATSSRREADNQLIVAIIQNMNPQLQLAVLDMLIENTELRNRDEFIRRVKAIQQMAGVSGPPAGGPPGPPLPSGGPGAGMPPGMPPMPPGMPM